MFDRDPVHAAGRACFLPSLRPSCVQQLDDSIPTTPFLSNSYKKGGVGANRISGESLAQMPSSLPAEHGSRDAPALWQPCSQIISPTRRSTNSHGIIILVQNTGEGV